VFNSVALHQFGNRNPQGVDDTLDTSEGDISLAARISPIGSVLPLHVSKGFLLPNPTGDKVTMARTQRTVCLKIAVRLESRSESTLPVN
jgi:hypothetical protein